MQVQAKFRVTSVEDHHKADGSFNDVIVRMIPVYGPENEPWSKYTPSGDLRMDITNENLHGQFSVGQEYMLIFDLVE